MVARAYDHNGFFLGRVISISSYNKDFDSARCIIQTLGGQIEESVYMGNIQISND